MKILFYILKKYKQPWIFPFWLVLFLFSQLYLLVITVQRKKGYQKKIKGVKIISVGNITVGGTGKTETALFLAEYFQRKYRTAIVLRGYRSKNKETARVIKPGDKAELAGDEALLLCQRTKAIVIISKKRLDGVALAQKKGCTVIILDDAFQHWEIQRDHDLVLVDYTDPFGNGHLIPAGLLREPVSALGFADTILITKYTQDLTSLNYLKKAIGKYYKKIIFYSSYVFDRILRNKKTVPINRLKNKRILIFSGIGNSGYFVQSVINILKPQEYEVMSFPDHHQYTGQDVISLKKKLTGRFDHAITTEKDHVKLTGFSFDYLVFRIKLQIDNEKKFCEQIRI